jgi:hypothetical protein
MGHGGVMLSADFPGSGVVIDMGASCRMPSRYTSTGKCGALPPKGETYHTANGEMHHTAASGIRPTANYRARCALAHSPLNSPEAMTLRRLACLALLGMLTAGSTVFALTEPSGAARRASWGVSAAASRVRERFVAEGAVEEIVSAPGASAPVSHEEEALPSSASNAEAPPTAVAVDRRKSAPRRRQPNFEELRNRCDQSVIGQRDCISSCESKGFVGGSCTQGVCRCHR